MYETNTDYNVLLVLLCDVNYIFFQAKCTSKSHSDNYVIYT